MIKPMCFKHSNLFFIKADGSYYPCCYTSSNDELRNYLGDLHPQINLTNNTVEQVLESDAYKKIIDRIKSNNPFWACKQICAEHKPSHKEVVDDVTQVGWDGRNKNKYFGDRR